MHRKLILCRRVRWTLASVRLTEASCHGGSLGVTREWWFLLALTVFTKHNRLSCVVLLVEPVIIKTRNIFQMAWNQQRAKDEVALFIMCDTWSDLWTRSVGADSLLKRWLISKRLLLYNKINCKSTGRTICNQWRKCSSLFLSIGWHRYLH